MSDRVCVDCRKLKADTTGPSARLRWCGDGADRCVPHRAAWIEKQHAENARVAARSTGSVGQQGQFLA